MDPRNLVEVKVKVKLPEEDGNNNLGAQHNEATNHEAADMPSAATPETDRAGLIKSVPASTTPESSQQGRIKPVSSVVALARSAKKDFAAPVGKRTQASFPLMKPLKTKYVRVHPAPEYRMSRILTFTEEESGEIYYVSPDLEVPASIENHIKLSNLYAAQAHDGTFFIWYIHHSDTSWFRAALKTVSVTTGNWRRVIARKGANTYDLYAPEDAIPEPDWSTLPPFMEMVESGFDDRMIMSIDHPVLRKLRGLRDDDE
jgi:hypothetical protein